MSPVEYAETRQEITAPLTSRKRYRHRFGNKRYFVGKYQCGPSVGKLKRADRTKPISTRTVQAIAVPNRPTYPLNDRLTLRVVEGRDLVTVQPTDLRSHGELMASGPTLRRAMEDFGRRFHLWVRKNWCVPPHLRTEDNEQVARILRRIVDWDRYDVENPLVQPMWGRILEHRPDGARRIFWVFGPQEARNQEAVLPVPDVIPALGEMPTGQWFYGTARCFPDRVAWVEDPEPAPDPEDEEARAALWDHLPTEFTNEPDAWPMSPD